jgi:hypothetical protein
MTPEERAERYRRGAVTHRQTSIRRFWGLVVKSDGCWLWLGSKSEHGYGYSGLFGLKWAHRVAYRLCVGPIPEGLELDHLCRVPSCVNPEHLEPVTHRENVLRGINPWAANARKTHCPKGHPLDGRFVTRGKRKRRCLTCHRDRERVRYDRSHRAAA